MRLHFERYFSRYCIMNAKHTSENIFAHKYASVTNEYEKPINNINNNHPRQKGKSITNLIYH